MKLSSHTASSKKYVGEGEPLVRSVFSLARRLALCIVFIDEIDTLFGARSSSRDTGSGFVHRGVIAEFMQEMGGLEISNAHKVIVIGATIRSRRCKAASSETSD